MYFTVFPGVVLCASAAKVVRDSSGILLMKKKGTNFNLLYFYMLKTLLEGFRMSGFGFVFTRALYQEDDYV